MKLRMTITALSLTLMMSVMSSYAMEMNDIEFPDEISVNGVDLILNGLGKREATIFKVDVYIAALYLEHPDSDGYAICQSEETKRLILHFVRDVGGEDIGCAWATGFMKNSGDDISVYESRIASLNSWMSELEDGDEMMFTYTPDAGLEVSVKGTVVGTIEGSDFASVFFSIWLGDDPPNGGLRTGLLGLD